MAHPGSRAETWEALREEGIGAVVTLTTRAIAPPIYKKYDMDYLHLPIRDFTPPEQQQIDDFIEFCKEQKEAGKAILVHCQAGIGRTGVMLACYLVNKGYSASEAIKNIRRLRPGALETVEQENAVFEYEARQ